MLPSTNIGKCTSRVAYPPSTCGTLIMALLVSIVSLKIVLNAVRKNLKIIIALKITNLNTKRVKFTLIVKNAGSSD